MFESAQMGQSHTAESYTYVDAYKQTNMYVRIQLVKVYIVCNAKLL